MLVSVIRTVILYIIVIFSMRLMGKKQIGQLQPSEFVIAMMLSELATIPMQDIAIPLLQGVVPILTLLALEILISWILLKSKRARRIFEGQPSILIQHGAMNIPELKRLRYNIDDVIEEIREAGYADIQEIEFAILETSGNLSIIPTAAARPLSYKDMKEGPQKSVLPYVIISDGKLDQDGLKGAGLTAGDVMKLLASHNLSDPSQVFFATIDENHTFYFQQYESK